VGILDRLGHRLAVSLEAYATARIRARSRQVRNVLRWTLVEQALNSARLSPFYDPCARQQSVI
nr:hypothetical protein [Pirellulaceae bacterium]